MSLTESIERGQHDVEELRANLARVREALDRTDVVLEKTDEALVLAGQAVGQTRRWAPVAALAVVGIAVTAVVIVVRRRRRAEPVAT